MTGFMWHPRFSENSCSDAGGGGCECLRVTAGPRETQRSSMTWPRSPSEGEAWMGTKGPTVLRVQRAARMFSSRKLLISPVHPSVTCRAGLRARGPHLISPIGTCHSLFYGLCTLTCVRVSDVPSFRQYLLTVREGPLFINLLSSKHYDAAAGQGQPSVWGPGAMRLCDRSPRRAGL